jgi:hypothetical protein
MMAIHRFNIIISLGHDEHFDGSTTREPGPEELESKRPIARDTASLQRWRLARGYCSIHQYRGSGYEKH